MGTLQKKKRSLGSKLSSLFLSWLPVLALALVVGFVFWSKANTPCANSVTCAKNLGVDVENGATGVFMGQKVSVPPIDLAAVDVKQKVLGETTASGEKHIYVDLAKQTLRAYEGDKLYMQALISSGKWGRTPTGDFRIWVKLRATTMSGGQGADYYNLPNVPYVMFFSNSAVPAGAGFSLHGTYWHNNFGHPMSHGCVNMRTVDAQKLFDWVNPPTSGYTTYVDKNNQGTLITIYGQSTN